MWVLCGVCAVLLNQFSFSAVVSSVYPVYASGAADPFFIRNKTIDVVVGTMYRTGSATADRRSKVSTGGIEDTASFDDDQDIVMAGERDACSQNMVTSCWTYNAMSLLRNVLQPSSPSAMSARSYENDSAHLVRLPTKTNDSLSILGRSGYWGLGSLYFFVERQLSKYIEGHAIMFPAAASWDEAIADQFQTPVVMDNETEREMEDSRHKTKKKSVIFPLLVLFKFFKIKIILIPILLTVLLIKKLLIATLALAPNIAGFFRVCRPAFGTQIGLAPAGILQDVSDSRGEFSTNYNNYAHPYRDYHGYRYRDLPRYSDPPPRQVDETQPDY